MTEAMIDLEYVRLHMEIVRTERVAQHASVAEVVKRLGLHTQPQEAFWVIAISHVNGLIYKVAEVGRGRHSDVEVDIPSTLSTVLMAGAPAFIVAHNHPTGSVQPSLADHNTTHTMMAAANACGLIFEDHLIVEPGGSYYSFNEAGLITGVKHREAGKVAVRSVAVVDGLVPCGIHPRCDRSFRPMSRGSARHEARVAGKRVGKAASQRDRQAGTTTPGRAHGRSQ
ncbi:MAG: JAB domain-containing protein [Candidatus Limnocylindria bacterium]